MPMLRVYMFTLLCCRAAYAFRADAIDILRRALMIYDADAAPIRSLPLRFHYLRCPCAAYATMLMPPFDADTLPMRCLRIRCSLRCRHAGHDASVAFEKGRCYAMPRYAAMMMLMVPPRRYALRYASC